MFKRWLTWTINKLKETRGDLGQMFSVPKSKSPWEAMTRGSTGGWANIFAPGEPLGFVGPLGTMAVGATGWGLPIAAAMGAGGTMGGEGSWINMGGYPGSDKPAGEQIMGTLSGAAAGYGAGTVGQGFASGGASFQPAYNAAAGFGGGGAAAGAGSLLGEAGGGLTYGQSGLGYAGAAGTGAGSGLTYGGLQAAGASAGTGWGSALAGGSATAQAGSSGMLASFMKNPAAMVGATGLATSAMIKTPEAPPIGPTMQQYLGPAGFTDVGRKAMVELEKGLTMQDPEEYLTDAYFEATEKNVNKTYDKAIKNLENRYAGYGMRYSGQLMDEIQKMESERANTLGSARAEALDRRYQIAQQNQYKSIMAALEVDEQTKYNLLYGEIYDVSRQYQADVKDIENLRQLAATAGVYGMLGSLGAFSQ